MTLKSVFVPGVGRRVGFVHRDKMKRSGFRGSNAAGFFATPTTPHPVDCTGNATVICPMDDNDKLGDCGEVMAAHVDNILTYRQGRGVESVFDVRLLDQQYEQASGGDNGLTEDDVINKIWLVGIAGNKKAVIVDAFDFDVTNAGLTEYLIDQFYAVCMAWSVPDAFLNGFATGTVWLKPGVPDPNNGHFTPLTDVGGPNTIVNGQVLDGCYRIITWGGWAWASKAFIYSVQPECFAQFSPRQFDLTTGLDSKGRHITVQAAKWQQLTGRAISASVINAFPPVNPTPVPPVPPSPPVVPPVVPPAPPIPPVIPPTPPVPPPHPVPGPIVQELQNFIIWLESLVHHRRAQRSIGGGPLSRVASVWVDLVNTIIADLKSKSSALLPIVIKDLVAGKAPMAILMDCLMALL